MEMTLTSHTPAHDVTATVAPFRAWRGSQLIIAGGPMRATIARSGIMVILSLSCNTTARHPALSFTGKASNFAGPVNVLP